MARVYPVIIYALNISKISCIPKIEASTFAATISLIVAPVQSAAIATYAVLPARSYLCSPPIYFCAGAAGPKY